MLRRFALAIALGALASGVASCVLGSDEPGCHDDTECDDGFVCRAGACFRVTTSRSPPVDQADAGDGG